MRSEEVSSFNRSCFSGNLNELVVEAARKRQDILVQVGLEYRYMPPVAKLINIVKGGSLGKIKMVAIREHRFPFLVKVPDIIDNAYVIVEFDNGSRGMFDVCMFAEGSKIEQEICCWCLQNSNVTEKLELGRRWDEEYKGQGQEATL